MSRHLEKYISARTEEETVKDFISRSNPESIQTLLTLIHSSDKQLPEWEAFFNEHVVELKPEQLVEE